MLKSKNKLTMKLELTILLMIILATFSCTTKNSDPEKWTDEEVNVWFEKGEWLEGWNVKPDPSINKRSLANYYHDNPKHWKQAFTFLKEADLKNLPVGTQELEGKHLFVAVSEYDTKDKKDTKYEAHRKYIDIQYLISGEEQMGLTTLDKVEVADPYDAEKDLVFYLYEGGDYIKATQQNFLIFFPEDAHRPCIKTNENVLVKKAVVKIMIE